MPALLMRIAAWALVLERITMHWSGVVRAWWRALMAIVVVLPHWRLQHRMRYLALVSRTSACLISGWKLRAVFAHSLAIEGPLPDGRMPG